MPKDYMTFPPECTKTEGQEDKCCAHPPEQVESGRVNGIGKAASSYEIAAPVENAEEDET